MRTPAIFTVGHSNHTIDDFVSLLRTVSITALADVRSAPYSRFSPQFNQEDLIRSLRRNGLAYVYLGDLLGGRPDDDQLYIDGIADYEKIAGTPRFENGIGRLLKGAARYRIALMCTEKDPIDCHRFLLVARALKQRGVEVVHIHSDGSVESMDSAERRLMERTGHLQVELFGDAGPDALHEAYRAQNRAVAFEKTGLEHESDQATEQRG